MTDLLDNPGLDDGDVPDEVAAMFDLKQKKKKKKKKTEAGDEAANTAEGEGTQTESNAVAESSSASNISSSDPPQYTYSQLLNRVVDLLHQNNPDLIEKRRYTMKPPQLMRGFYSFLLICNLV